MAIGVDFHSECACTCTSGQDINIWFVKHSDDYHYTENYNKSYYTFTSKARVSIVFKWYNFYFNQNCTFAFVSAIKLCLFQFMNKRIISVFKESIVSIRQRYTWYTVLTKCWHFNRRSFYPRLVTGNKLFLYDLKE